MKNAKVAVIGSGVAGATVADILLSRGSASHVSMFEAGPRLRMTDRRTWVDFLTTTVRPYWYSLDTTAEVEGDPSAFLLPGGRLMIVGGSTVHWGGWCPRLKPEDFELRSRTGQGLDWQMSYNDLAPFYEKAEQRMRIAGDSSRNDPPRFGKAYPVAAVPLTQMDGPVVDALEKVGFGNYGSLPIARNEQCVTTGTCRYCPVGGRYEATMDIRKIPGRFMLKSGAPVTEIIMRNKREAQGIRYRNLSDGSEHVEDFDFVFVCAGAIESAKLLLASQSRFWPKGIGNDTDHVGRHLLSHPRIQATGIMESNPKAYSQEVDFPTLECRHFDTPAYQKDGKLFFVRDDRDTTADFARDLTKGATPDQLQQALLGPMKFTLSGFVEQFESAENRVELASGTTRFGLPKTKITFSTPEKTRLAKQGHLKNMDTVLRAMGIKESAIQPLKEDNPRSDHAAATCRMSKTADTGVVAGDLRVHDCDNVYICSNAVMPNIAAVNPTLTLVALITKMAEAA
jgi:choline dehydrogenase-like flavoprotein